MKNNNVEPPYKGDLGFKNHYIPIKDMAIDYCLDKINTEGKQMSITS